MTKMSFGLFGLFILSGYKLGSEMGIAVAICIFMVASGLLEEFKKNPRKNVFKKKEVK